MYTSIPRNYLLVWHDYSTLKGSTRALDNLPRKGLF